MLCIVSTATYLVGKACTFETMSGMANLVLGQYEAP